MLKPIGRLQVELVEAQNIAKADILGESDPYAVIYIRRKQGCICTSSTITNTKAPVWNETFHLNVCSMSTVNNHLFYCTKGTECNFLHFSVSR